MTTESIKDGLKKLNQCGRRMVAHLRRLHETLKQRSAWLQTVKRGEHQASSNDRLLVEALIKQMELYIKQDIEFAQHLLTTGEVLADGNLAVAELLGEHIRAKIELVQCDLTQIKAASKAMQ